MTKPLSQNYQIIVHRSNKIFSSPSNFKAVLYCCRCAGEVAASANNGVCGVGVAFNARIGGIRMLDGDVTDAVEGGSLSHAREYIDIYSSSWGPEDKGVKVDGPGKMAKDALRNGRCNPSGKTFKIVNHIIFCS